MPSAAVEALLETRESDADLSGEDLSGLDLSEMTLTGSMRRVNASATRFDRSSLSGDATDANFGGASFVEATLSGIYIACNFAGADLTGAQLKPQAWHASSLAGAKLVGARAGGIAFGAKSFTINPEKPKPADDEKRKLAPATDFSGADLSEADLSGCSFAGGYQKSRARINEETYTRIPGASLNKVTLRGAKLAGASLTTVSLVGADLRGADLAEAILERVDELGNKTVAKLVGARYDDETRWPAGFDPEAAGARKG